MKFFLDEHFPKSVTSILEEKGHQVFDIRSTKYEGSDDKTIFKLVQEKEAIFLTTDKDFFHTIPYLFEEHFGIIVITLRQPNRKNITDKLVYALNYMQDKSFKSKILYMKDNYFSII